MMFFNTISYQNQGLQEIFVSFSGQSLICPYNSVSWSIDSGDGMNTWLSKEGLVCSISNPELFTQLDLSYTASLGGKIDGVWKESTYKSITFTLTGESGIEYYSGSEKTISLANITEPVNLHVTWKAKIANSAYDGDFKISSVSVVIK